MQQGWGRLEAFNITVTVGNSIQSQWLCSPLFVHEITSYTVAEHTNMGYRKQNAKTRKSYICEKSQDFHRAARLEN